MATGVTSLGKEAGADSSDEPVLLTVVAPSPSLTVTVEGSAAREDDIHLHAGGQGFWVARMGVILGAKIRMSAVLGGESGRVLRGLIENEGIELDAILSPEPNATTVTDRRRGEREVIATSPSPRLNRHAVDSLFGAALSSGLDSRATVLTGLPHPAVMPADFYRRLAADLRHNDARVLADLSGEVLAEALAGGVDLVKVSDQEALDAGYAADPGDDAMAAAASRLQQEGAANVLISRAEQPAIALVGERLLELHPPRLEAVDPHGAGDSMFAAAAVGIAAGRPLTEALRLAVAAGSLNVTRHGLGTGREVDVHELAGHVVVREIG
jgi:1-phosphofructokinase